MLIENITTCLKLALQNKKQFIHFHVLYKLSKDIFLMDSKSNQ